MEVQGTDKFIFYPKGYLLVIADYFEKDKRVDSKVVVDSQNIIVNSAKLAMPIGISDPDDHSYVVKYFAMGTGHHAAGDPDVPVQPIVTETALETELYRKAITNISYPTATSVSFYTLVSRDEGNIGSWYTEFGLFSDSAMFAIRASDTGRIRKNDNIQLEIYWRISF